MGGGGVEKETIKTVITKKRKKVPLFLALGAFLFILSHTTMAQQVSFALSTDTIHSFDDLIITNTSANLPPGTGFRWEFSGTNSLTVDSLTYFTDSTTMDILLVKNNTQIIVTPGFPMVLYWDTLTIKLVAIDSNGVPLSLSFPSQSIAIGFNYPFPLYNCDDPVNDPCLNIVCNGSFEDLSLSSIFNPWQLSSAVPWFGTHSEIFHSSYPAPFCIPNNMFGTQSAISGNRYAGFHPRFTNADLTNPGFVSSSSEVISTMLKYSLDHNQTYQVTFYASLADRSNIATRLNAYLDLQPAFLTIHHGSDLENAMNANPNGVIQNSLGYITNVTQFSPITGVFTPSQTGVYRLYIGSPDIMDVTQASGNWGASTVPGQPPTEYLAYYYVDDVKVVPLPATITIEGNQDPNICTLYHLVALNPLNVASYQWCINGIPVVNTNQSSVSLPNPLHLPIQCLVTNYHGCESVYTWEPEPCHLVNSADIVLKNPKVSDLTDPQSPFYQYLTHNGNNYVWNTGSNTVVVLGTLTIDQDFSIVHSDHIIMGSNARIVVEPSISLEIRKCTLYSCDFKCFMWDGIYATHPNSSLLIDESTISNAKNAVYSRNNPILNIIGNHFIDNLTGIHLTNHQRDCSPVPPGQNPPPLVPANVLIVNNIFKGELWNYEPYLSLYLPGFNGMEWGIKVDTVDLLTIGPENTFRELSCGIHINTGNVVVLGNVFELIAHHTNTPGVGEPFGHFVNVLYKEGAIVINKKLPSGSGLPAPPPSNECVPEKTRVENNHFDDCRIGVYAWDIPLEILANAFFNTKYNALRGQSLRSAVVSGNSHSYSAIQQMNPNNVFNYEYYIGQPNQNGMLGYDIDIQNNVILTYKNGISLTNATSTGASQINPKRWVLVGNNTIYLDDLPSNPTRQGIRLQSCDRAKVFRNTIANIDANQFPAFSMALPNLHGIHVSQTVDARVINNFTIKRFGKGIYNIGYNKGTQYWCNQLEENYNGFYCEAQSAGVNTEVSNQLMSGVENNNSFVGNVYRRVNNLSMLSFDWYYTGAYDPSNPRAPVNSYGIQHPLGQPMDPTCAPLPPNWMSPATREELFGIIVREGDTLYGALQEEFEWYADEYLYKSLYWDNGWMYLNVSEDSVYQHYFNYFDNEAIRAFTEIEELIGMGELEQALWNNNNVVTQTLIEFNQQLVNEIYLETWAQGIEPDSNQISLLEAVALLTPYVGGNAVYTARVMLDIDPFNYGLPYRMAQDTGIEQELQVVFYPNPAGNRLFLEFMEPMEGTGTFELYDVQGRKVFAQHLQMVQSILSFDTSLLKDGLYIARLQLSNGKFVTQKIVINH